MVSSAKQSLRCKIYRQKKKCTVEGQMKKINELEKQNKILKENLGFEQEETRRVMAKYRILEHNHKLYKLYHGKCQYDRTNEEIADLLKRNEDSEIDTYNDE